MSNRKDMSCLPFLVIEKIFDHLSYYQILNLRLLSKFWDSFVLEYLSKGERSFVINLLNSRIQWVSIKEKVVFQPLETDQRNDHQNPLKIKKSRTIPRMSPRFYYLSCCINDFVYIYGGGLTIFAIYNDLWRFDLKNKTWQRIISKGTLPIPRLFGSFTPYSCIDDKTGRMKQYIVLFGGITLTDNGTGKNIFSTIHLYDIDDHCWKLINIKGNLSVKSFFHSAVIMNDELIVCHGNRFVIKKGVSTKLDSNQISIFDLKRQVWRIEKATDWPLQCLSLLWYSKRYENWLESQQQYHQNPELHINDSLRANIKAPYAFRLDDNHILYFLHLGITFILKRTTPSFLNCPCDLSNCDTPVWKWKKIDIGNLNRSYYFIDFCRVGDLIIHASARYCMRNIKKELNPGTKIINPPSPDDLNLTNRRMMHTLRVARLNYYQQLYSGPSYNLRNNNNNSSNYKNNKFEEYERKFELRLNIFDISKVITDDKIVHIEPINHRHESLELKMGSLHSYSLISAENSLLLFGCNFENYFNNKNNDDLNSLLVNKFFMLVSKSKT